MNSKIFDSNENAHKESNLPDNPFCIKIEDVPETMASSFIDQYHLEKIKSQSNEIARLNQMIEKLLFEVHRKESIAREELARESQSSRDEPQKQNLCTCGKSSEKKNDNSSSYLTGNFLEKTTDFEDVTKSAVLIGTNTEMSGEIKSVSQRDENKNKNLLPNRSQALDNGDSFDNKNTTMMVSLPEKGSSDATSDGDRQWTVPRIFHAPPPLMSILGTSASATSSSYTSSNSRQFSKNGRGTVINNNSVTYNNNTVNVQQNSLPQTRCLDHIEDYEEMKKKNLEHFIAFFSLLVFLIVAVIIIGI